jgi:mannosyltransferase OCH1-like enzyme
MINKILHFIWIGDHKIPTTISTWEDMHPEWKIYIWNESKIKTLSLINSDIYELKNKRYNQKSDIIRLEILYRYGGVYVDADIYCLKNIDSLILNNTLFFTQEKKGLVSNSIIGSRKKNIILLTLIKHIKEHFNPLIAVWKSTGPGVITKFLEHSRLIRINPKNHNMRSVSRCRVFPYYYVNIMSTQIRKCIFSNIIIPIDTVRDIKYYNSNGIVWDNIFGVQLWMGGKSKNYRKILDLKLIKSNIFIYLKQLRSEC